MKFTGERYIPGKEKREVSFIMGIEHFPRYSFAQKYVKDKIVVDAACGAGYGSSLLGEVAKNVTGVDISEETINYANETYKSENIIFKQGSITNMDFIPDNSVDVVVSFETIEHVSEDVQINALKEFRRILKEDGLLIISSPNTESPYYVEENEFHIKEFNKPEFEGFLKQEFKNVVFGEQYTHIASCVLSGSTKNDVELESLFNSKRCDTGEYILALCSNSEEPYIDNYFYLDQSNKLLDGYKNTIKDLESKLITNRLRNLRRWLIRVRLKKHRKIIRLFGIYLLNK